MLEIQLAIWFNERRIAWDFTRLVTTTRNSCRKLVYEKTVTKVRWAEVILD